MPASVSIVIVCDGGTKIGPVEDKSGEKRGLTTTQTRGRQTVNLPVKSRPWLEDVWTKVTFGPATSPARTTAARPSPRIPTRQASPRVSIHSTSA